eukprot:2486368-Ditylum_brightwellii.AAC.1
MVKEGKVIEVWFGCTTNSNSSWGLDQDYLLDQSNNHVWSVDFFNKCHHNQDEWTQVESRNSATTAHLLASPILHIPLAMENVKLANRWVAPLLLGNPVIAYQQHDKDTHLFDSLASVMAYYGDKIAAHTVHAASQQKHPL